MKQLIFTFLLLSLSLNLGAQSLERDTLYHKKNDVIFDPIMLIVLPAANFNYERLISRQSGIGANTIIDLSNHNNKFYQISPFYRMYFGKGYASGFFIEGFIPITLTKEQNTYYQHNGAPQYVDENIVTAGAGFGFGGKWVVRNRLVFEIGGGIGRRFTSKDYVNNITAKLLGGIGYRF